MIRGMGPVPAAIVDKGDTLSHIAERYLGRARAWPLLAALNRIADPRLIQPGDIVALPYGVSLDEPEEVLPDGLVRVDGQLLFDCRVCGEPTEWPLEVEDWDPDADGLVCGRSPRCCP